MAKRKEKKKENESKLTLAIELAVALEQRSILQDQVCEMLRLQNEAISLLREALEGIIKDNGENKIPSVVFGLEVLETTKEFSNE